MSLKAYSHLTVFTTTHPDFWITGLKIWATKSILTSFLLKNTKIPKTIHPDLTIIHYQTNAFYHKRQYS